MNPQELGNAVVAGAYFTIGFVLLAVAFSAWRKRGLLRLVHPLIWVGAATFFFGCGGNMAEMVVHSVSGSMMHYDSLHHEVFTAMQVVGAPPFIAALVPFWKQLRLIDIGRRR